jgi:formylglycine-generating enzyme required for sulfatase activity
LLALVFISFQAHAKGGRGLAVTSHDSASKRIALVIGNGNYQHSDNLPKLANPTHDAEDIAAALRGFGFEVIEKRDVSLEGMSDAIIEFSRKLVDSDAALFYFAGHGLQVKGQNYIIPIDARIETVAQVPFKSINVNLILDEMENGKSRANIVMLDACRNNPISGKFRSGGMRGLAVPTSQPKGTVIVYATDPGNTAADGDGRNGLFTAGLLTAFKGNDLSLHGVLSRASKEVERSSGQKQTPYINGPSTLQEEFHFGPGTQLASLEPVPTPVQPAARIKTKDQIEDEYWDSIKGGSDRSAFEQYRKTYPKGRFLNIANIKIAQLKKQAQQPAPVASSTAREDNDTALWNEAQKGNSADDYDAYLTQYPKGKYIALARSRIKKLQNEATNEATHKEQDIWESANQNGNEDGYQSYLKSWPAGKYASLAQARIHKLQTEAGTLFRDCPDCPEMIVIPTGSYDIGEAASTHRVSLKGFAMGKSEITQGQWKSIMGNNPSKFASCGENCPVDHVSWDDAQAFVQKLNIKTGKQYRLPSEVEWECACRAGARQEYCGSDNLNSVAWYGAYAKPVGNSAMTTNQVASKQANAWGLYDMSGNVWEWTNDCWEGDCAMRVIRGGAWNYESQYARAAFRDGIILSSRINFIGFRLARTLP